jgi:TolB-like protein
MAIEGTGAGHFVAPYAATGATGGIRWVSKEKLRVSIAKIQCSHPDLVNSGVICVLGGRCYQFGPFRLEVKGCVLLRHGKLVRLPPKVAKTLLVLVENAGKVMEKEALLNEVWEGAFIEEGSLPRTISVLRKILWEGSGRKDYIATIPKYGYRFSAPVIRGLTTPASAAGQETVMLAVLPFVNLSGSSEHDHVGDGLTEELTMQLSRLDPNRIGVIARTSAASYKSTSKSVTQIGEELGVAYLLEGSVRREDARVRIAAQLIYVGDQTHVWAESYERELGDILRMQLDVAGEITQQIGMRLAVQATTRNERRPIEGQERTRRERIALANMHELKRGAIE